MIKDRRFDEWLAVGIVLTAIAATYYFYSCAFDAPFQFDDSPNLDGLSKIRDWESALGFILQGKASALGRPLALATFALNSPSWPTVPADFFHFNACIHLLNGILVFCFIRQVLSLPVSSFNSLQYGDKQLIAATCSALWLINPLLLSTSMMVVQRMTLLSASGMLLTLIAYLHLRTRWGAFDWRQCLLLMMVMAVGGGVSLLFKETAVNLIFYLGVIEYLFLFRADDSRAIRFFRFACVVLPIVLTIGYIGYSWQSLMNAFANRPFSGPERLLSAPRVLVEYLLQALVPRTLFLGPYHDDFAVSHDLLDPVSTLASLLFWIVSLSVGFLIRRRLPLLSFAIFWFVAGHLLEAGPVSLEIYFEHRNYLPLIGPLLWVASLPFFSKREYRRLLVVMVAFFGVSQIFGLAQAATLWGDSALSARLWRDMHPDSERAAQYYAQSLIVRGDNKAAREVIAKASARLPMNVGLAFEELQLDCLGDTQDKVNVALAKAIEVAASGEFQFSALDTLGKLTTLVQSKSCHGVEVKDLLRISESLLQNHKYRSTGLSLGFIYLQRGLAFMAMKDLDGTIDSFDASFHANPDIDVLSLAVGVLIDAGLPDEAAKRLNEAREIKHANPVIRSHWLDRIEALSKLLHGEKLT